MFKSENNILTCLKWCLNRCKCSVTTNILMSFKITKGGMLLITHLFPVDVVNTVPVKSEPSTSELFVYLPSTLATSPCLMSGRSDCAKRWWREKVFFLQWVWCSLCQESKAHNSGDRWQTLQRVFKTFAPRWKIWGNNEAEIISESGSPRRAQTSLIVVKIELYACVWATER